MENNNINKIEFLTTPCFGTCPVFSLEINANGTSFLNAESYNYENEDEQSEIVGKFKTVIAKDKFDKILKALKQIDFSCLEKENDKFYEDMTSYTLTLTYNDNQVKEYVDKTQENSDELNALYKLLFDLRFNQKWEKQ